MQTGGRVGITATDTVDAPSCVSQEHCHQRNESPPAWVRAMDAPGLLLERMADWMESYVTVSFSVARSG